MFSREKICDPGVFCFFCLFLFSFDITVMSVLQLCSDRLSVFEMKHELDVLMRFSEGADKVVQLFCILRYRAGHTLVIILA